MEARVALLAAFNPFELLALASVIFSTGFSSGDFPGQLSTAITGSFNQVAAFLANQQKEAWHVLPSPGRPDLGSADDVVSYTITDFGNITWT